MLLQFFALLLHGNSEVVQFLGMVLTKHLYYLIYIYLSKLDQIMDIAKCLYFTQHWILESDISLKQRQAIHNQIILQVCLVNSATE